MKDLQNQHLHVIVATAPKREVRRWASNMKTMMSNFLAVLLATPVIASTNTVPTDLSVMTIAAVPFSLGYDGKLLPAVGIKTNGFEVVAVTSDELTLRRGDSVIRLRKGQRMPYTEYIITILDKGNGKQYDTQAGSELKIGSRTLAVGGVNPKEGTCTLRDVSSGETWIIRRQEAQQSAAPLPPAPQTGPSDGAR